jgi:hypothetical protein
MRKMGDDAAWLNLYVLLSRATALEKLLVWHLPGREMMERGPPESLAAVLQMLNEKSDRMAATVQRLFPTMPHFSNG